MSGCILIGGGSGMIGSRLTEILLSKGYEVRHLGRKAKEGKVKTFVWDIHNKVIDEKAFDGVSVVINLAGAHINGHRWTKAYKEEILKSRTDSTRLIVNFLNTKKHNVTQFISGSAVGYYGFGNASEMFKESDPPGADFMAHVTKEWERVASECKISTAILRTGIVVSENGGAVEAMAKPVKLYVGAPLASGKQMISWIHIDDECGIIMHIIENQLSGAYNLVAPNPVSNEEMTKLIAASLHKPLWLPNIPAFALKIILGEMSDAVVNGQKVSSAKIQSTGYIFKYPELKPALKQL